MNKKLMKKFTILRTFCLLLSIVFLLGCGDVHELPVMQENALLDSKEQPEPLSRTLSTFSATSSMGWF